MNILSNLFSIDSSPTDSSPRHKRNCAIEGVRGVAILLVFLCHYADIVVPQFKLSAGWQKAAQGLSQAGRSGVALFFVLSGYLIYRTVARKDFHLLRFWGRRVQRIYPAFLAVFSIYLTMWLLGAGSDKTGEQLSSRIPHNTSAWCYVVENLLFLPGIFPLKPLMNVAWSLSYEWFFYLAIPLGAAALGRIARPLVRLSVVVVLCGVYLLASYCKPAVSYAPLTGFVDFAAAHNGLVMFLAGVIVYEVLQLESPGSRVLARWEWPAVGTILLCLCVPFYFGFLRSPSHAPVSSQRSDAGIAACLFVAYGLLLCFSLRGSGFIERAMSFKPLRSLGNISYSFYLIHGIPIHVAAAFAARSSHLLGAASIASVAAMLLFLPVCLLFTTCVSLALFVTVERPASLRFEPKQLPQQQSALRSPGLSLDVPSVANRFADGTLPT